jgi:hypothetical protein
MILSRRDALTSIAAVSLVGLASGRATARTLNDGLSRRLPASAAVTVDRSQFLPSSQMRQWHVDLDALGLRATGSAAHDVYIDSLHDRLVQAGVKDVRYEDVEMQRWTPTAWGLAIGDRPDALEPVEVSAYVPYSGVTPEGGVFGELAYLTAEQVSVIVNHRPGSEELIAGLAGKIVVAETPVLPTVAGMFTQLAIDTYDRGPTLLPTEPYRRSWISLVAPSLLETLEAVGGLGLVVITADSLLPKYRKIYGPYDAVLRETPGLYVDQPTGDRLRQAAAAGQSARLILDATLVPTKTRNVIGVIPGRSDELVVLNSHTDGTNGLEDNGPDVIVDIAQYLARLPTESLPRSVMIMLSAGHFAGGNAIKDFLRRHADDGVLDRINCVLTIEHLGLQEWVFNAEGELEPTGRNELAALFTPEIPPLVEAAKAWAVNADASPTYVIPPTNPNGDGDANGAMWPGEGQYFWGIGGIPTINYITGPACLLNYDIDTVGYVDFGLLRRQTIACTQMILDLGRVSRSQLPRRVRPSA